MARLRPMVAALREVRVQRTRIAELEHQIRRISPQVAALEQRVEHLERRLGDACLAAVPGDEVEVRTVLDEVRNEHSKVRARITAATVFEERLRVVESQLGIDSLTGRRWPQP